MKGETIVTDPLTLYKLILLYILDHVDYPLTNSQLSEFLLEKEYTTYFTIQTALSELEEAGFVSVSHQTNTSFYTLTVSGEETLEAFASDISEDIRAEIGQFLKNRQYELRRANEVTANYFPKRSHEYTVEMTLHEKKDTLMRLELTIPGEDQARVVCDQFLKNSSDIYNYLMTTLLTRQKKP